MAAAAQALQHAVALVGSSEQLLVSMTVSEYGFRPPEK
jgi:hypothetical protein